MLEFKHDRDIKGQDIYLNGSRIGWVSFGDCRKMPKDRRPVTILNCEKVAKHHKSYNDALEYIKSMYKEENHV